MHLGSVTRKDVLKTSSVLTVGEDWAGGAEQQSGLFLNAYWLQETPLGDANAGQVVLTQVDSQGHSTTIPITQFAVGTPFGYATPLGSGPVALIVSRSDQSFGMVMNSVGATENMDVNFRCGQDCAPSHVAVIFHVNRNNAPIGPTAPATPLNSFLAINNFGSLSTRVGEIMSSNGSCQN